MNHVVLLGDSVFDNASYVPGEPAVVDQVRDILPLGWQATLLAVDGDGIADVGRQLAQLPEGASHVVVSAGGNDALAHSDILNRPVRNSMTLFLELARIQQDFSLGYERMLQTVLSRRLASAVCTIYDEVPMPDETTRRVIRTALSVFNDSIIRVASLFGVPVLDLRRICSAQEDYSRLSPIEPSSQGGSKIAAAIVQLIRDCDFGEQRSSLWPGRR
jgi:hypothetical protein